MRRLRSGSSARARQASSAAPQVLERVQVIRHQGGHAQLIGYARVSTREQNLSSQLDELERAGCSRVYAEKCSSVGHRVGWAKLMGDIRKGDSIVVVRLDRIGRKLAEVVTCIDVLTGEGVYIRALAQQIDTRAANGRLLVPIWSALAETERELLRERTCAGLEAARKRGQSLGRPTVLTQAKIDLCGMLKAKGHSVEKISQATGLGNGTVRKALELGNDISEGRQLRIEGA